MPAPLKLDGVSRRFGRSLAVDNVSLEVASGTTTALLGPNGAGKSTLLRIAATLLRPERGSVRLFGLDPQSDGLEIRRRIGFLSHESFLYPDLTPVENLQFYARLFGLDRADERIEKIVDELELGPWLSRPLRALSRGASQRAALARALLHDPDLLFLDEPFTGLDAESSDRLDQLLGRLRHAGKTVVLSTHDLGRVAALADHVVILRRARLGWCGPLTDIAAHDVRSHYDSVTAA